MAAAQQRNLFEPESPGALPLPWEEAAAADLLAAQVVFNRPLETVYQYLVPDRLRAEIVPGQRVKVPLGRGDRLVVGFCVGLGQPALAGKPLKWLHSIIDRRPLLSDKMLELTHWMAERYLCAWGQALSSALPAAVKNKAGTRLVQLLQATAGGREALAAVSGIRLPAKQRAALAVLVAASEPMRTDELARAACCGPGPIEGLRRKGFIEAIRERVNTASPDAEPITPVADLQLNSHQNAALEAILGSLRAQEHRTILLHGVTGSGKTEVYIQAIREIVSYGRQAIVLVPEISLTPQTIRRFRSRFDAVAVLHSHLTDVERHREWQRIAGGRVQVVVGARSAVFAPTPHLGLIVIDEEHETTFKQETTPRYHAREVARKRAELEGVPLVLGSATPTLESWLRVSEGKDRLISLPERVGLLSLPPVVVVDVRNDPQCTRGAALGRALEVAMHKALADDGQVILLLNLRGYTPTLWCRACGQSVKCPHCDITLTWHKDRDVALCHVCDFHCRPPASCPACGHSRMLHLGAGTQRLEQEVRAKFADAKVVRMDSDSMRRPGSHDAALEAFRRGEVQILLGTQMIAKGLDFPHVTLVGVVNADTTLHQADLRAAERTFQLVSQVAGRTGRSARGGRVLVQTTAPTEPCILKAAEHDYEGFVVHELEHRRRLDMPPFEHFVRVIFRGPEEREVRDASRSACAVVRELAGSQPSRVRILGPAPAPVAKLKNHFRHHFLLASREVDTARQLWTQAVDKLPQHSGVEFAVDVDPLDMR